MAKGLFTKSGFHQTVDSLLNLTGIAPLRGSRAALPIACDALNARTMAIREYHYVFCASSPTSCCACFPESVLIARQSGAGKSRRECVMAHPPHGSTKRNVSDLPYAAPPLSCVAFFFKVQKTEIYKEERGGTLCVYFSVLKDRTARMSFACSRSRKSSSMP